MPSMTRSASMYHRDHRLRTTDFSSYFTDFTYSKGIFYGIVLVYVSAICFVVLLDLIITGRYCDKTSFSEDDERAMMVEYANRSYRYDPCRYIRYPYLLWLNREECSFGRSLLASVLMGGIVGWERRMADRPAGIRTMALVSLGSCLFTINSTYGFIDGPMSWDSSRVAAAIPSGVGFLGAGLIFKEADKDNLTGDTTHVVHGLTTAASLWISSAIGVACAGRLYYSATFSVALLLTLLRFGPRLDDTARDMGTSHKHSYSAAGTFLPSREENTIPEEGEDPESQPLQRPEVNVATSYRSRASLGGIL